MCFMEKWEVETEVKKLDEEVKQVASFLGLVKWSHREIDTNLKKAFHKFFRVFK